ncbi:MAG: hypothetical protein IT393_07190 [Nitrospirae bacterium]|nr:hypothetical protein [Nitrospirota bacterium]
MNVLSIECKPYEAFISTELCKLRKKRAFAAGDGITFKKCLECKEGETVDILEGTTQIPQLDNGYLRRKQLMKDEQTKKKNDNRVRKCRVCERVVGEGEKYSLKTEECKQCYQRRWLAEKRQKEHGIGNTPAPEVPKREVKKQQTVARTPSKDSGAMAKLDEEIAVRKDKVNRLTEEIEVLERVKEMLAG